MNEREHILATIRASETAVAIAEILASSPEMSRRSAQRWIRQLVESGEVVAVGQGRGRRDLSATHELVRRVDDGEIPLSTAGREVLEYVSRPAAGRTPVGYQREFLESYRPGETYYVPATVRDQLRRMGATGAEEMPAGTYGRDIMDRLMIDLSWASSHLEGNTYSRLDTRELLEHGRAAKGRAATETQMILNHKAAIELLVDNAETVAFDRYTLLNLHSTLSENLLPNPRDEGRIRQHPVGVGSSVYVPLAVPSLLEEMLDLTLAKAQAIDDPFEQAFFAMVHLPYLQAFADVNKRTSRLAANIPLIRANLVPLTFIDVPQQAYSSAILGVYELTRYELLLDVFIWAYERSAQQYAAVTQSLAEPDPLRLAHRDVIKATVRRVVENPATDPRDVVESALDGVAEGDRSQLRELVVDELRRLHEGALTRYGLRPAQYLEWRRRGW